MASLFLLNSFFVFQTLDHISHLNFHFHFHFKFILLIFDIFADTSTPPAFLMMVISRLLPTRLETYFPRYMNQCKQRCHLRPPNDASCPRGVMRGKKIPLVKATALPCQVLLSMFSPVPASLCDHSVLTAESILMFIFVLSLILITFIGQAFLTKHNRCF